MEVKAKKYLGQHFLLDKSVGKKIAQALNFNSSLNLLEIGPGTGALTEFINLDNIHLVAYELDQESVIYLNKKFPTLEVYNQDVLAVNWKKIFKTNFAVTGNVIGQGMSLALTVGFIGGIFPAWNAARRDITEALRSI